MVKNKLILGIAVALIGLLFADLVLAHMDSDSRNLKYDSMEDLMERHHEEMEEYFKDNGYHGMMHVNSFSYFSGCH